MAASPSKLELYQQEEIAARYDERWRGARGEQRNARKWRALIRALRLLEEACGRPLTSVLDVPCGTGRFTADLQDLNADYLGCELSPAMLVQAKAKSPEAALVAADLAALPLPDNAVDVALCIRFLHLMRTRQERAPFLKELRRVSRFGTVLDFRHNRTIRYYGRHLQYRLGRRSRPPANPSLSAIRAEVLAAEFEILSMIPVHRAPGFSDKLLVVCR